MKVAGGWQLLQMDSAQSDTARTSVFLHLVNGSQQEPAQHRGAYLIMQRAW